MDPDTWYNAVHQFENGKSFIVLFGHEKYGYFDFFFIHLLAEEYCAKSGF